MDEKHEQLAQSLLDRIEETEDEERYRSYRDQLYGIGPDVLPLLRGELTSYHYRRRMAAATNLGRLGDAQSAPALVRLLTDPQAGVREMALFALGILGDASVTDAILNSLNDYDADVRYRALVALSDLGYAQLEDVLIRCMSDEAYGVREQALGQLRTLGTVKAVPAVLRALLERESEMQQMAEEALDRLVPKMTRDQYKQLREQLKPRERRLILNYLEARNLQEVYGTLWKRLQLVSKNAAPKRDLDKYGRVLNSPEEREFLTRAFGRDAEVDLLVDHFAAKNVQRSILLVGEAGVGKTAIIQEFVKKLDDGEGTWKVLETNTSELISGTRYLGDWETKLKEMTEAILKDDARVILYVTNPNDLLGAGAHSKSDENFADFFKPYLQRGQLHMIAECTEDAIKGGLSRDPGFLRLFRQVKVRPMDDAQTLDVLKNRIDAGKERGDRRVLAAPGTLAQVVDFAKSFYTRSHAPGRACDLLDALIDFAARQDPLPAAAADPEPPEEKEEIDPSLSRKVPGGPRPLVLSVEQIPACLSEITGISLDLLDDSVPLDLDATETWFKNRLIDQNHAVDSLVDRLAIVKAGLGDPQRPLGVYFLVGPTGVGKTYFSKLVAERLFGDAERMIRFDLSEYQGRFAVEKLIGSPHDKDREGLLTEAVKNQPFSVLLFDEFEKADGEIYNLFLQILDEGRLTDASGRTTDFRQTLIFLTSNLGASKTSIAPVGFGARNGSEAAEDGERSHYAGRIHVKLDEFFAPEFLNRLDEVVVFDPLTPRAMERLVGIEIQKALGRRGFERRNLRVRTTPAATRWLEEHGFSERFGARELKRVIERSLLAPISRLIVRDPDAHTDRTILVDREDGELTIDFAEREVPASPVIPRQPRTPSRVD
jgi:ATP-dependent Clp protease ATP-binding subunit ClpC